MLKRLISLVVCALLAQSVAWSQDQGMTSETHKKNLNKIVWAKQRIAFGSQDSIPLQTAFNANDPIYGRVYLPKSLVRLGDDAKKPNPSSEYRLKLSIDGADKGVLNEKWFDDESWTTVQINLTLTPDDKTDSGNSGVPDKWAAMLKTLPDGAHKVQFEFWGGPAGADQKFAEGGFSLTKAGAVQLPSKKLPAAKMKDAALEASMIQAVKDMGWTNETPVKVVIIEPEWRLVRDAFGTVTDREINTHVVLKSVADGAFRANDISFRQAAQGGDKFGRTGFYGLGMITYPVSPEDAK